MEAMRQPLAHELLQMVEADQAMRMRVINEGAEWDSTIDEVNQKRLMEIVRDDGWPTIPKVGPDASQAAWLLVQHAPSLDFMEHCLELMQGLPQGEVNPANIAYLKDRVLMMQGKPQIYGTQFQDLGQGMQVYPIQEPDRVDELRASVGLGTFAENEAQLRRLYSPKRQR